MMTPTTNTPTSIKIVCHHETLASVEVLEVDPLDPEPAEADPEPAVVDPEPAEVDPDPLVVMVVVLIRSHTPRYFEPCIVPIPKCYRGMRNPTSQTVAHKYDLSGSSRPRPHFDKDR